MAKRVGQVRYFNHGAKQNQPSGLSGSDMRNGVPFKDKSIVQLGIQALPGLQVNLNYGETPIVVGSTGIYELNVEGLTPITDIRFPSASINMIEKNPNAYIIVDYIYEEGE